MKTDILKLFTFSCLSSVCCAKVEYTSIVVTPSLVEHIQGQTSAEVTEESMLGMNFGQSAITMWRRYIEETYGESGTEGRQGSSFEHASIADSLHHTQSLYRKEISLFELLGSLRTNINNLIEQSKNLRCLESNKLHDNQNMIREDIQTNNQHFPTAKDLKHVSEAIIDIMDVYKLDAIDIVEGNLRVLNNKTMKSKHKLVIEDCSVFAKSAGRKGRINIKIEWLELEKRMKLEKGEDLSKVKTTLKREKEHHDFILTNFGKYGPGTNITGSEMKPYSKDKSVVARATTQRNIFKMKKREVFPFYKDFPMHKLLKEDPRSDIIQIYREEEINKMCRGTSMTRRKEDPLRKSAFLHHNNPYLLLAPFKLSVASEEPFIGRIISFLSGKETKQLREQGGLCLKPRIYSNDEGNQDLHHFTAKEICYVSHKRRKNINRIRQRFQLLMNTNFKDQFLEHENFQIVNYGHGGSLKMHQDHSPFHFVRRLSTFMVYLSNVHGGHTVFPVQGITESPVEGDALLWHTLNAKGEEDQRTQHTACPVIFGSKWVVNLGLNFQENWGVTESYNGAQYQQWNTIKCLRRKKHYDYLHN